MKKIFITSLLLSNLVLANQNPRSEFDLAPRINEGTIILDEVIWAPSNDISIDSSGETKILIKLVDDKKQESILTNLDFEIDCASNHAVTRFDNKYFKISKRQSYELNGEVACGKINTWTFDATTPEGQILSIYKVAMIAVEKLKNSGVIGFWTQKITFRYPGDGDYYNYNTVNLTRGNHWDVVGHELGHAIYDQAGIGAFGGGSHKIDECYSGALALSEGWASFFSAWLSIDLNDPNAQFEYMVPRRAPLEIETIPSDVCKGPRNEWRVTGFMWDLIDHNEDGESLKIPFAKLWETTLNKDFSDTKQLAKKVLSSGYDPILINIIWENNFLEKL